ncbi:MAG: CHAT domain-containing protein [candidate division WOR-3 bacterium]|nr:CHAT domain-containing protein [candidate division WOR-3 bacterium]
MKGKIKLNDRYSIVVIIFSFFFAHAYEIDSRIRIADSLFYTENYAAAESLYKTILEDVQGINKGMCLKGLGNINLSFGDLKRAKDFYQKALEIFTEYQYYPGQVKIYLNLGSISLYYGDLKNAKDFLNNALKIQTLIKEKTQDDLIDEINVRFMLAKIALAENEYKNSKNNITLAIEKSHTISYKKGMIDGYHFLANFYVQRAEADSALKYFSQSCSLAMENGYHKSAADAYQEIGNIHRRLGEYDIAYENLMKSLNLLTNIKKEKEIILGEGELLNNIGSLYLDMGKYRSALEKFMSALDIFDKTGNISWKIEAYENIGYTYTLLSHIDSSYFDSALYYYNLTKPLIKEKKDEALFYNNLGILYERKKDFKSARDNYQKALILYKILQDSIGQAKVLCNLGNLYVLSGDYKMGIKNYQDGYNIIGNMKRKDWQASILSNLGFAQHKADMIDEAINSLSRAVDIIENLRGRISTQEFRSAYFENKIVLYEELINLYYKKQNAKKAFEYAEAAKARAFLDLLSGIDVAQKKYLDPQIKYLLQREKELERRIEFLTGMPEQVEAIIEYNKIIKELSERYPDYKVLKSSQPIDIRRFQSMLDDETAFVEYFIGINSVYVFAVTSKTLTIKKIESTPAVIFDKVDEYRRIIRRRTNYDDTNLAELSYWFYSNLIAPVVPEIKNKRRLGIVPYGVLHNLPFSTILLDKKVKKLLIDEFDIFYIPSASVYEVAHNKNKLRKSKTIIFAKSDFSEHPEWFDLPLPGTIAEKDSIVKSGGLTGVNVFSDESGSSRPPSETNARKYLKDYDIIHLATHGKLAPGDSALESRLILSKDEENDGELKVREIFNMEIDAYLVTLSACETGQLRGFSEGGYFGDELTGLSRAFIFAGTPSVIASLWKVSDVSTALLMAQFYKNLKGADKTKALCDAQRWLMKKEYFDKPFFWAPFVVIGDWR